MKNERGRILVVDDQESNRDMLCRRLQRKGFETHSAPGGREALEKIKVISLDVVLLDWMMPELDGLQVLEELRVGFKSAELPVIMVTAKDQTENIVESLQAGANDYVTKPIDFQILLARIRTQISLKRQRERNQALIKALPDCIMRVNKEGLCLDFNKGREVDSLPCYQNPKGNNVESIFPDSYGGEILKILKKDWTPADMETFEFEMANEQGSFFFEGRIVPCPPEEFLIIIRDISDRKRFERLTNEFISVVSHELRTPLTSIIGSLGLVEGGMLGEVPEKMKEVLKISYENSQRLVRLINDLLDIQKIEAGKMDFHLEKVEVVNTVKQALKEMKSFDEDRQIRFELDSAPEEIYIEGDRDRLLQVLINLLSNGAKFSPAGEVVKVNMERKEGQVRVEVVDKGPGIPEKFHSRIFKKFSQVDSSDSRQKGGTGLGLSICQALVERMGGEIGFETKVDEGTTFYFCLPTV